MTSHAEIQIYNMTISRGKGYKLVKTHFCEMKFGTLNTRCSVHVLDDTLGLVHVQPRANCHLCNILHVFI